MIYRYFLTSAVTRSQTRVNWAACGCIIPVWGRAVVPSSFWINSLIISVISRVPVRRDYEWILSRFPKSLNSSSAGSDDTCEERHAFETMLNGRGQTKVSVLELISFQNFKASDGFFPPLLAQMGHHGLAQHIVIQQSLPHKMHKF